MVIAAVPLTIQEQLNKLRPDSLYEVVDGDVVEIEHMGFLATTFASVLLHYINAFAIPRRLGVGVCEGLYRFREDLPQRRPDVSFVPFSRWPAGMTLDVDPPTGNTVPTLAVEVVSPTNTATEIERKRREYFDAGVISVWVIFPTTRTIHVFHSPNESRVFSTGDTLNGGAAIPGFTVAVNDLFDALTPPVVTVNGTP